MSPEHKHEAEYYARAAEQAGYRAELEVPTIARTVVDVVIEGGLVRAGVEVQLAHLKIPAARDRTKRTMSAGITVAWSANSPKPPLWFDQVPSFMPTMRMWQNLPPPRSIGIAGPVTITPVKCEVGAFQKCPGGHRRPCHQYHPRIAPWLGLLADDVATLMPAGEMIPLQLRKFVRLVSPASARLYEELTGQPAAFSPGKPAPDPESPPSGFFECNRPPAVRAPDEPVTLLELWSPEPQTLPTTRAINARSQHALPSVPRSEQVMCPRCGTARLTTDRSICQACKVLELMYESMRIDPES
jgi:hypothetical protein